MVNIVPEIEEGIDDEMINVLEEIVEELQVDEKLTQTPNTGFALEITNIDVKAAAPRMKCKWEGRNGKCCFKFHLILNIVCVKMHDYYPYLVYEVNAGSVKMNGHLDDRNKDRKLDIPVSHVKLEFEMKLESFSTKSVLLCFKADYHADHYNFNNQIGCTKKQY